MHTLSAPASRFNPTRPLHSLPDDNCPSLIPSGHMDEGFAFSPEDDALMVERDHEQAIDCGTNAISDDLAAAEAEITANHPGTSFYASFQIHRLDGRTLTRWNVNITRSPVSVTGSGATLRDALDDAYNTLALPPRAA